MVNNQGPIEYWTSRFYVCVTLVGTAIVTGVGTVGLVLATAVGTNPPPPLFTVAFVLGSCVIWYGLLTFFALEIAVWPSDGRVVFRCLAKERQTTLGDITTISMGAGRSNAVTVRYRGGTARVLKYMDWHDFISRVREQNPGVKVQGF